MVQFAKRGTALFSRRPAEKMCLSISRLSRKPASAVSLRVRLSNTRKSRTKEKHRHKISRFNADNCGAQINHAQSRHDHHHSPRIIFSTHPCALVSIPTDTWVLLDTGPTKPHTRCVSGGLCVLRQVTGTNRETPTLVGVSFCLAASARCLQPIPFRGSTKPRTPPLPSKIRDVK